MLADSFRGEELEKVAFIGLLAQGAKKIGLSMLGKSNYKAAAGQVKTLGAQASTAGNYLKGKAIGMHNDYKTTDMYKKHGNKPLYAAGAGAAFLAGRATAPDNSPNQNIQ